MKKLTVVLTSFLFLLTIIGLSNQVEAGERLGCYKKNNGQLRIVSNHSDCLKSEDPITLATGMGTQNVKLECVTAVLSYETSGSPDYCNDPSSLNVTNPYPSDMNPEEAFEVYCESPSQLSDEEVMWGLGCKEAEGWLNTGCTGTSFEASGAVDIAQAFNACLSDDEEYGNGNIFTTCCKIVSTP